MATQASALASFPICPSTWIRSPQPALILKVWIEPGITSMAYVPGVIAGASANEVPGSTGLAFIGAIEVQVGSSAPSGRPAVAVSGCSSSTRSWKRAFARLSE